MLIIIINLFNIKRKGVISEKKVKASLVDKDLSSWGGPDGTKFTEIMEFCTFRI